MRNQKKSLRRSYLIAITCVALVFALSGLAYSQTIVNSNIITDATWSKAGSPYIVTKSIDVYPRVTLTIEPGIEVKFNGGCDLEIYGELMAIGTESERITFTSNSLTPSAGDWGGIIIKEGAIGTTDDGNDNYVSGSIVKYCEISYGGGLRTKVDLFILNNTIKNNIAVSLGGGIYNEGNSYIGYNNLANNSVDSPNCNANCVAYGGGIYNSGESTITHNNLQNNSVALHKCYSNSYAYGGGIYNSGESTITHNNLQNNSVEISNNNDNASSYAYGGGIYNEGNSIINNNTLVGNCVKNYDTPGYYDDGDACGGGIYNKGNSTINNNTLTNNSASSGINAFYNKSHGGGIYNNGTSSIRNNTLKDNSTYAYDGESCGGGIFNEGSSSIINNTLTNNSASGWKDAIVGFTTGYGAGIYNTGAATVSDNTITGNRSTLCGGGLANTGTATITNNTIKNNSAEFDGGGIHNVGAATITTNTVVSNIAKREGGGIYTHWKDATIQNNTITDNSASSAGGIYNSTDATITNNIISANVGGGIYNSRFSYPLIDYNEITGNTGYGIETWSLQSFTGNNIYKNANYDFYYTDDTDQIATNNYWGTTNTPEIDTRIYDYWDDISLGKVIYKPFAIKSLPIVEQNQQFADVPSTHWAFNYINAIKEAGITTGCGSGCYCPDNQVTREQMAAFIIRALCGETFSYESSPYFADVPASHWAFKYIQKLKELSITTGCGYDQYCPEEVVTRDQMAAFLIRATVGEDFSYDPNPYFTDVTSDHWAFDYIQKLKELGITTGCGSGQYCPSEIVTRDQMAAFLSRAFLQ